MSHTTLEDVFLKLAKASQKSSETFVADVRLPRTWEPGQAITHLAADGIEYDLPAEQVSTQRLKPSSSILARR